MLIKSSRVHTFVLFAHAHSEKSRCKFQSHRQPYAHIEPAVKLDKPSVHELGLFANRDILKDRVVCPYSGICEDDVTQLIDLITSSLLIGDINLRVNFVDRITWNRCG